MRTRKNQRRNVQRPYRRNTGRHSYQNRGKKRKLNKKKVALVAIIFIVLIMLITKKSKKEETLETTADQNNSQNDAIISVSNDDINNEVEKEPEVKSEKEITDWRLTLANYDNLLPEDFEVELANIDETRQFDARAIEYLKSMINAMWSDGISNIWVQSAYRSVERQKELYNNSVQKYLKQGKTQEEAEKLTEEYINKPGSSDHNLGLAVDFNNVDNNFEDLKAFKWLQENAEDYGFILRYPKDKEDITKIAYESWHWRFVGEEHAKKMNELNMCLEEYIEYLKNSEE